MQTPDLEFEKRSGFPKRIIAGVDEVGRGCLAGPVVAAAAVLPPRVDYSACPWISEVTDSKLLRAEQREKLDLKLRDWLLDFAIEAATVQEIDRINIHHASHLAMERAVSKLKLTPEHVLVDGCFLPKGLAYPATAIVKGDRKSLSIAAASILAKVYRDRHMRDLDSKYPGYGLAEHKGYPTPFHLSALQAKGATGIHRISFAPVAVVILGRSARNLSTETSLWTSKDKETVE